MNKYPLMPATLVALAVLTGCNAYIPAAIQNADLGKPSRTETTAPLASERHAPVGQPEQLGSPASATPTPSTNPTGSPLAAGVRVTGKIYGTNPKDPWNGMALVNDKLAQSHGTGQYVIDTVLTPEADGKTYLYANTTGIARGAVDHVRADHGKLYGGNYSAGALKWIKIEVPTNAPTANIDLFLSYPIGHALADEPGTHTMGFPTYLGETKRVITVAPMYKNGERRYKTPMVSETMLWLEEGKTYQVDTDGSSLVKLENIEDGRWYAFQAKLTLPNGEAETTVGSFLGGRKADTVLLGEDKVATPFDPDDPTKVL